MPPCVSTDDTCNVAQFTCYHLSSREKTIQVFSRRDLLTFDRGFSNSKMNGILKYRWDFHIHKVTLRNGLISRNHFTTGLLFVTISYRKGI